MTLCGPTNPTAALRDTGGRALLPMPLLVLPPLLLPLLLPLLMHEPAWML